MVNKVQLIGRLGQNPEFRTTQDGAELARFSLATDRHWTDSAGVKQTRTDWHQVVAWGRLAEISRDFLAKGRLVYVEGRLQTRSWEKDGVTRYTTEIVASDVQFLGGRDASDSGRPSGGPPDAGARGSEGYPPGIPEDDIPF